MRAVASAVQTSERLHGVSAGGVEIERKFLLPGPPPADVLDSATAYAIDQTYLTATSGARRVRRRIGPDGERFWLTEKHKLGGITRSASFPKIKWINWLSADLPCVMTAPESPPLSVLSRVSSRRPPFTFVASALWHL